MPADIANSWDSSRRRLLYPILNGPQQVCHEAMPVYSRRGSLWFDDPTLEVQSIRHGYHPTDLLA